MWSLPCILILLITFAAKFQAHSSASTFLAPKDQVTSLLLTAWMPPATHQPETQSQLTIFAGTHELISVSRDPSGHLVCEDYLENNKIDMQRLPDIAVSKWKLLALEVASSVAAPGVTMCLVYSASVRACVLSHKERGEMLEFAVYEVRVEVGIPAAGLEIHVNEENLEEFIAESLEQLRLTHNLEPLRELFGEEAVFWLYREEEREKRTKTWKFAGIITDKTSYLTESGGFLPQMNSQSLDVLLTFTLLPSELFVSVDYSRSEGIGGCSRYANRPLLCSSWISEIGEHWGQTVLIITSIANSSIDLCYSVEKEDIWCHYIPKDSESRQIAVNSLQIETKLQLATSSRFPNIISRFHDNNQLSTVPFPLLEAPRSLLTEHYSFFTYTGYYSNGNTLDLSFYNTHTATTSIYVSLTASPSVSFRLFKKNNSGPYSILCNNCITTWVYPSDTNIINQGGILGEYRVRVFSSLSSDIVVAVKITCTQTSGDCYCSPGYYPDPSTSSCTICPSGNVLCQNIRAQGCLPMTQSFTYTPGSFSCTQCSGGLYYDPSTEICGCYPFCATCQGPAAIDCLSCKPNSCISGSAPNTCICNQGYFRDISTNQCSSCDSSCYNCSSSSSTGCTACYPQALLVSAVPSACVCDSTYYPNSTVANCSPCHSSCKECSNGLSTTCNSCWSNAMLSAWPLANCICVAGYTPVSDASHCEPCDPTCALCAGTYDLDCTLCKSNALLVGGISPGKCVCNDGYFPHATPANCIPCSKGCTSCTLVKCLSCTAGFFLYERECVSSCPSGSIRTKDGLRCERASSPVPQLIVLQNNSLTVQFDKPMKATISSEDISVNITSQLFAEWASPLFTNNMTLLIALYFSKDYIPSSTCVLLAFLTPEKVTDYESVPIEVQFLSGILFEMGASPWNTSSLLQSELAQQITAAATGGVAASMISSVFSGSAASLLATISQFQLIAYLSLSPLPLPDNFTAAIAALNVNSMIPNPLIDMLTRNYSSQTTSGEVAKAGIDTTLLFPNILSFASVSLLVLFSYFPLKLGAALGVAYCARSLLAFKWSIPLNMVATLYLDLGIYSLLQIMSGSFADIYLSLNTLCGFAMAVFFLAAPVSGVFFLFENKSLLSSRCDESFNNRWSLFLQLFSPFKPLAGSEYYFAFFIRRFMFVATLFTLPPKYFAPFYFSLSLSVPLI